MFTTLVTSPKSIPSVATNVVSQNRWKVALLFPAVIGPVWCIAWHSFNSQLGTLAGLVLLSALVTSAVTDYQRQRIFNWTTYSAVLWALAINVIASIAAGREILPSFEPAALIGPQWLGGIGISECLGGAALCFFVTMIGYDLSGGGAGDVKLAAVIGALLGVHAGIFAIAYSYVVAGIAIVAWSAWTHGPVALASAGLRKAAKTLLPFWPIAASDRDKEILLTPVPLGPYFAIGTLLVVLQVVPT